MEFVTNEKDIILPKGGLIIEEPKEKDWVLGASPLQRIILQENGQWDEWLPVPELQKALDGDTYGCVSFSNNNCHEILHKRKYGFELNMDDRYLTVGSGTVPGQGNSVSKVAEWKRNNGFIVERNQQFSLAYYYRPLTPEELAEGLKSLEVFTFNYEWLPRTWGTSKSTPEEIIKALKYGPVQVSVDGSNYSMDSEGRIGAFSTYTHEVLIFGYELNNHWKVFDSETLQPLKFKWSYPFGWPMLHEINKLTMRILKKNGQAAIGFYNSEDGGIYLYADGAIAGGSLFKIFFGDYKYAPIERVDEWPYPIKGYITTTGLISNFL